MKNKDNKNKRFIERYMIYKNIKIYIKSVYNLTMQLQKKKKIRIKKNIYLRLPIKLRKKISENLPFNYRNVEENKNHHWSR